jgi:hypothetical protein
MENLGLDFTVGSVRWSAWVDADGRFVASTSADIGDVRADTYAQLKETAKVRVSQAKTKVDVPYAYLSRSSGRIKHGSATGIHGSNKNILAVEGGVKKQLDRYAGKEYFKPPSPEDAADLEQAVKTRDAAQAEMARIMQKYQFSQGMRTAVENAVTEAMQPKAPEE